MEQHCLIAKMTEKILIFICLHLAISASDVRSNNGRHFLLPVNDVGKTLTLKIVTNNATQVSIKGSEVDLQLEVPAKSAHIHEIPIRQVEYSGAVNMSVQNKAVVVSATSDIWLYVFVQDTTSVVGGLTAVPVKHLSNDYRVATYDSMNNFNFVTMAAVEDNTVISIMIKTTSSGSCTSENLANGEILVATLNKNDVLGLVCEFDITGSMIYSNSSIAVISGHSNFNEQELSLRIEMLVPVNSYGTEFVLPVPTTFTESIFRVIPAELPAEVTIGANTEVIPNTPGFLQVTFSKSVCLVVNSTSMVIVYSQASNSGGSNLGSNSMAEMSLVPSTDRYQSAYIAEMPEYEELFMETTTTLFTDRDVGEGSYGCMTDIKVINMSSHYNNWGLLPKPFGLILYEPNEMVPILSLGMLFGVDMCESEPCMNNATCIAVVNDFVCQCELGFSGTLCEINLDDCQSNPCSNNATCIDGFNDFECECKPGFTGVLCEKDIDECESNSCLNNATCVDGINTYLCECEPGFNGTLCETNIDDCYSKPCQNNGSCDDGFNEFICHCAPGFSGELCEKDNNECYSNPCVNNGSCIDGINQFVCQCEPGFNGTLCDIPLNSSETSETDRCASGPCQNNATCLNEPSGFNCKCMPGFTGDICEQNIDECLHDPCQNNAICVDGIAAFLCQCEPGFTGISCETALEECQSNHCDNNATCYMMNVQMENPISLCQCLPGYTGEMCQLDIDECTSNPCGENHDCVNSPGNFSCQCKPGFIKPECLESLSPSSVDLTVTEYSYKLTRVVSLDQSLITYSGDVITDVVIETDITFSSVYSASDPSTSPNCNSTCLCTRYGNKSVEYVDLEDIVDAIKGRLLLDKNKLLKTTLKYISRADDRPTAKGIGSLGCIVIIGTILVLVVPDLFYVLRFSNKPVSRVEYVMK